MPQNQDDDNKVQLVSEKDKFSIAVYYFGAKIITCFKVRIGDDSPTCVYSAERDQGNINKCQSHCFSFPRKAKARRRNIISSGD